jgi:hypothetical protein
MDFDLACKSVSEIARVLIPNGLFCFDLIAEDCRYSPNEAKLMNNRYLWGG